MGPVGMLPKIRSEPVREKRAVTLGPWEAGNYRKEGWRGLNIDGSWQKEVC